MIYSSTPLFIYKYMQLVNDYIRNKRVYRFKSEIFGKSLPLDTFWNVHNYMFNHKLFFKM